MIECLGIDELNDEFVTYMLNGFRDGETIVAICLAFSQRYRAWFVWIFLIRKTSYVEHKSHLYTLFCYELIIDFVTIPYVGEIGSSDVFVLFMTCRATHHDSC